MSRDRRDRGSTLILVLVLVVVCSLIVVPLLTYAVSVTRAGVVQSDKAQAVEYARSGLRTAVTSTRSLYENCGSVANGPVVALASNGVSGVTSTCQVVSTENYRDLATTPYQVGVIQVGQTVPAPFNQSGLYYPNPNSAAQVAAWYADRRATSLQGTVWTPTLPARPTTERTTSSGPPQSYGRPLSYGSCNVYYPGTYTYPVEVRGPTPAFFVSGVYYFESTLTFRNGATAVIGDGEADNACTTDIEALTYVPTKPDVTNISGVGATFVFGKDARMIVDNSGGAVSVTFNQRYVSSEEVGALPSAGVSIISVDGDTDANPNAIDDLFVKDVIANPRSTVNINGTVVPVEVGRDGYRASTHTPEPYPAAAPTNFTATAYRTGTCGTCGAATLTWAKPASDNGYAITEYVVYDADSGSPVQCVLPTPVTPWPVEAGEPQRACTITGMTDRVTRTFYVTAVNAGGESPSSNQDDVTPRTSNPQRSTQLITPGNLTNTQVAAPVVYQNGALVDWVDGTSPSPWNGGTPITSYTVTATQSGAPGTVVSCTANWWPRRCLLPRDNAATPAIDGLVVGAQYTVRVVATNMIGSGAPPSSGRPLTFNPTGATLPYTPPGPRPPDTVRVPDPVIDVRATNSTTNRITLQIPGYIAIAQGRMAIDGGNTASKDIHDIDLTGGVLAARIDVADMPASMKLELANPVIQKTIRLVTQASGRRPATGVAIVQINDNFGWAVNSWVVQ